MHFPLPSWLCGPRSRDCWWDRACHRVLFVAQVCLQDGHVLSTHLILKVPNGISTVLPHRSPQYYSFIDNLRGVKLKSFVFNSSTMRIQSAEKFRFQQLQQHTHTHIHIVLVCSVAFTFFFFLLFSPALGSFQSMIVVCGVLLLSLCCSSSLSCYPVHL